MGKTKKRSLDIQSRVETKNIMVVKENRGIIRSIGGFPVQLLVLHILRFW